MTGDYGSIAARHVSPHVRAELAAKLNDWLVGVHLSEGKKPERLASLLDEVADAAFEAGYKYGVYVAEQP